MVVTNELKDKVFEICKEILGDNATDICVPESVISEGDSCETFLTSTEDYYFAESTEDYDIKMGITKVVIVPHNEDFVIKMDISKGYIEDEEDNIVVTMKLNESSIEKEMDIYERSEGLLREFLVPNFYVGLFNKSIPIFVQEKCGTPLKGISLVEREEYDVRKADEDMNYIIDDLTNIASFSNDRGIYYYLLNHRTEAEIYGMAFSICRLNINDLHGGNLGFDLNNNIRIWDYAGYDEDEHWIYV